MLRETTIFNFKTLSGHRSIIVNFENKIFMGVGCQTLGRNQWKNRDKTGKMLNFPELLKGNFYHLSLNGKNTPISPF